jgi:hypothetical protein
MVPVGKKVHSQIDIINKELRKNSRFSGLVEAIVDADGKIKYKSTFDGIVSDSLEFINGHLNATGINAFQTFTAKEIVGERDAIQVGRRGIAQLADEIDLLNERLKNINPTQRKQLERLGLKDLIGQEISMTRAQFIYEGKSDKLASILELDYAKNAGILNITDKGVTVINYATNGQVLSSKQAKLLNNALGLGHLTDDISKEMAEGKFKNLAKVTKRQQGLLAPRDISITGEQAEKLLDPNRGLFPIDDVSAMFRGMLDFNLMTEEERFIMAHGLGFDQGRIKYIAQDIKTGKKSTAKGDQSRVQAKVDFRQRLIDEYKKATGMTDAEFMQMQDLMKQSKSEFDLLTTDEQKKLYNGDFVNIFRDKVKGLTESKVKADKDFGFLLKRSLDGIEQFRDGTAVMNVLALDETIDNVNKQIKNIIDQKTPLTEADIDAYRELKNQLDGLMKLKQDGQEGLDSAIARMAMPGGQGKGEVFIRKFDWLPEGLRNKLLYLPQSAVKKEIQSQVSSIALNVAKTHKEQIYSDPLALLYHQEYFGKPEFMEGVRKNVQKQMEAVQKFMDTGILSEDARKHVIGSINSELEEEIPLNRMTAGARASALRNREEARAIQELLQSGVDPRQIPALVRRITDYYQTQTFRIKMTSKGERVDVVMPNVARRSIKTYESVLDTAVGAKDFESTRINITSLGEEGKRIFGLLGSELGAAPEVNFMQFRLRGQNMLISGANAHLYHHSLGTFDLDDKGLPIMTSFKGADGKDRFAFMTLRQPTGFQEKIYMQADLSDADTLKSTMDFFSGDFKGLLNDATIRQEIAGSEKQKRIFDILRRISNGEKNIDFRNIKSDDINTLMMDLVNSDQALNKYGFSKLVGMSERSLLEMAVTKSSSPLGLDKVIRMMGEGETNPQEFKKILQEAGIKKDIMPQYTAGNFINIITEEEALVGDNRLVEEYNKIFGTNFKTKEQLNAYVNQSGKKAGETYSDRMIKLRVAQEQMIESLQASANLDVENSLGLYINRQSFAAGMSSQIEETIALLGKDIDISDYYRASFSVGIIPPSEAVDVSKSLIGRSMIQATQMEQLAQALGQIGATGENVSEEAVAAALSRLGIGEIKLGSAGAEAIAQTSRGVGFLRAIQMAKGVEEGSQIGFDAAMFGEGSFARITSEADIVSVINQTTQGAERARALLIKNKARQEEIDRIDSFISRLKTSRKEDALTELTLKTGTAAYDKYGLLSKFSEETQRIRSEMEGMASIAQKRARAARDSYQAVAKAEHVSAIDNIIEARRSDIEQLQRIIRSGNQNAAEKFQETIDKSKVNTFLNDALAAVLEKNDQINALDLMDTLEARINSQFDETTSRLILSSKTNIVDEEHSMIQLIKDARSRRVQKRTLRTTNIQSYDILNATAKSRGYGSLKEITPEIAKDFISDRQREIRQITELAEAGDLGSATMLQGMNEADSFYDFMRLAAGEVSLTEQETLESQQQMSRQAIDALRRLDAEREMARLEQEYNGSNTTRKILQGSQLGDEARQIVDDLDAADNVTSVKRGTYKTFSESLKNGALKEVFQDKLIRNSAYAMAGLAAFGFIYSARKDRTHEEASGPPLLPGGSAYETDMPKNLPSLSDLKYLNPVVAGMQYKINVMGSQQDIDKMQYLAGNVVGGPVDSTMYNSLPRLGRDPYSQVASRY